LKEKIRATNQIARENVREEKQKTKKYDKSTKETVVCAPFWGVTTNLHSSVIWRYTPTPRPAGKINGGRKDGVQDGGRASLIWRTCVAGFLNLFFFREQYGGRVWRDF